MFTSALILCAVAVQAQQFERSIHVQGGNCADSEEEVEEVEDAPQGEEQEVGIEGGVRGGVIGGVLGGMIGDVSNEDDIATLKPEDIQIKREVPPRLPRAARALDITAVTCQVRFFIDEAGEPYDIQVEQCPSLFHENVLKASWKWRFYPHHAESGDAVKSTFVLTLTLRD